MRPSAMVGSACAGMFRFLVGAAALALCVTSSAPPASVVFMAFVGAYLAFFGLAKIGAAHGAASDLEDALDRPEQG